MKLHCIQIIIICYHFKYLLTIDWNRETQINPDNGGSINFLAFLEVMCNPGEALNAFQYFRPTSETMTVRYKCDVNSSISTSSILYWTTYDIISDRGPFESIMYMDRHNIQCNDDYVLMGFIFQQRSDTTIRYQYNCALAKLVSCNSEYTTWQDAGFGNTHYLDRHIVAAQEGMLLTGFHLNSQVNGKDYFGRSKYILMYNFNSCLYRDTTNEIANYINTNTNNWGYVSDQNKMVKSAQKQLYKYGQDNNWTFKEINGDFICDNKAFGDYTVFEKKCFIFIPFVASNTARQLNNISDADIKTQIINGDIFYFSN